MTFFKIFKTYVLYIHLNGQWQEIVINFANSVKGKKEKNWINMSCEKDITNAPGGGLDFETLLTFLLQTSAAWDKNEHLCDIEYQYIIMKKRRLD